MKQERAIVIKLNVVVYNSFSSTKLTFVKSKRENLMLFFKDIVILLSNLDSSVQRGTCKCVVVLGIYDNLHHIVGVSFEHLRTGPFFLPIP